MFIQEIQTLGTLTHNCWHPSVNGAKAYNSHKKTTSIVEDQMLLLHGYSKESSKNKNDLDKCSDDRNMCSALVA